MNEIEKMYKNVGVEPTYYDACTVEDDYWQNKELANKYGTFDMYMDAKCGNQENCTTLCRCAYTRKEYPPFTAEKQLKLIALLANREIRISPTYMCSGYCLNNIDKVICSRNISTFETSLAQHINAIWQSLTEEKEQIKEILDG